MKIKKEIKLHMHDIKNFLDNRFDFYQEYYNNIEPTRFQWKGVQKAFTIGNIIDIAIKNFYLKKQEDDGLREYLIKLDKTGQITVRSLIDAYKSKYEEEYFHDFQTPEYVINIKKKHIYKIHCRPDLICQDLLDDYFIIEIKTSGTDDVLETLDFQTMFYAWAFYKFKKIIPKAVIKRVIHKPRIKQKQKESVDDFNKRIIYDIAQNEDKYFTSNHREITEEMIIEFENYFNEIILELDNCLYSKNKYKFYKSTKELWP